MKPKIQQQNNFILKTCSHCGGSYGPSAFIKTNSLFYKDGYLPICATCIDNILEDSSYSWDMVDKLCQWADIPFIPTEFEKLHDNNTTNVFSLYATIFLEKEYEGLGWDNYFKEFQRLKEEGCLEEHLPLIGDAKFRELQSKWGANYDAESLIYLENLYIGLNATQNVGSALQIDQALKICKISYEIDNRIRAGSDFDKLLSSYEKLVKTADFTPKSTKNAEGFDSFGEVARWLEKRGWRAKYYDEVTQDIVDETIKNIKAWNQRLYTEESGIGDEITRRIEALKTANELENNNYYLSSEPTSEDIDQYDVDGFDGLYDDVFSEDM